jgi:nitrogen fixation protein NifZ
MSTAEADVDIFDPPRFSLGARVRAVRQIRNDGTFPGRAVGEVLVCRGEEGYVRDIGSFLQRHWVYAVDFIDRRAVVGMRGREIAAAED